MIHNFSKGLAVEDTHGWDDTHRFKHTPFQYTCFQTHTIQIHIGRVFTLFQHNWYLGLQYQDIQIS